MGSAEEVRSYKCMGVAVLPYGDVCRLEPGTSAECIYVDFRFIPSGSVHVDPDVYITA